MTIDFTDVRVLRTSKQALLLASISNLALHEELKEVQQRVFRE